MPDRPFGNLSMPLCICTVPSTILLQIEEVLAEAIAIPDGQNELRRLQLRELALLNGTLRPEDLASGARCSNCGANTHKTWECHEQANVTQGTVLKMVLGGTTSDV